MMTYTDEQLRELAEKRYGTDIHLFAQQRDGFIEGYKDALKQVKNNDCIADVVGSLPTRKVCFFTLKDGKYLTENNIEITIDMLVKRNHQITDSWSYIIID